MLIVPTRLAPSAIHGLGLFAAADLPAGSPVWVEADGLSLRAFTPAEYAAAAPTFRAFLRCYAYRYLPDVQVDPDAPWLLCLDDARFMNHADAPNLIELPGGPTVAARAIVAGEELTCDYRAFAADWAEHFAL